MRVAVLLVAYFVPAIVAFARGTANRMSVLVVDLFLAWTIIGWVVALAMAVGGAAPRKGAREYPLGRPREPDAPPEP